MVESVIRLNIEESVQEKTLKPDDFQFLLAKHTEQVSQLLNKLGLGKNFLKLYLNQVK